MLNLKKIIVFFVLISFLIVLCCGSVSATNLVVNESTTHNDISSWMRDNSTVKGDNLIFNTSKYELSDTIVVSKSVNIRSNVKTSISFNKNNNMFNVTTSDIVCFSGLTLNHSVRGTNIEGISLIFSNTTKSIVNIENMKFNLNNDNLVGIFITNWKGNITNSLFKGNKNNNSGIIAVNWTGNIYKSSISLSSIGFGIITVNWTGNVSNCEIEFSGKGGFAIFSGKWNGNFYNSNIKSKIGSGIFAGKWNGNISNSKIQFSGKGGVGISTINWIGNLYNSNITSNNYGWGVFAGKWTGKVSKTLISIKGHKSFGFLAKKSSKGFIENSKIHAKKGIAVMVSKNIKVKSCNLVSLKGEPNIYVFGPRIEIPNVKNRGNSKNYFFTIKNYGEYTSKTSYLIIKTNGYIKKVKIKPIEPNKYLKIIVNLPSKYSSKKYTKYSKIEYADGYGKKVYSKSVKFKW